MSSFTDTNQPDDDAEAAVLTDEAAPPAGVDEDTVPGDTVADDVTVPGDPDPDDVTAASVDPDESGEDGATADEPDVAVDEPVDAVDEATVEPDAVDDGAADDVIDADDLLEELPPVESPYDRPGAWYVVHTQSGYEKKVKHNLEARTSSMNMEGSIYEVVIPMEDVMEFKNGKKVVVQKKVFPGYLLVRCTLDDDSWYVIRNTPGITGFVGSGAKPSPLPRKDVEMFLAVKTEGEEVQKRGKPRLEYEINETVRVKEGPFADFSGEIVEINEDQLKVKVLVNIFGRETPVELEFSQVAKL